MSDQIHEGIPVEGAVQPESAWAALRLAREARGLSLHQVSDHLKLTVRQIEAIERGDLSVLPGATFARGFVRNYARFLDLDPAVFLAAGSVTQGVSDLPEQMITPSLGRMPSPGNPRYSALPAGLLVLLLVAVLGAGWHYGWFESREEMALLEQSIEQSVVVESPWAAMSVPAVAASPVLTEVLAASAPAAALSAPVPAAATSSVALVPAISQPVAAVRQSAPAVASTAPQSAPAARQSAPQAVQSQPVRAAAPASAVSAPLAASGLPRLVLSFDGDSWVEVRDATGKIVFARLNQAGVVQEVQGAPPFDLVIGNASKVRLNWKGRAVDLLPQTKGDVARVNLQ